jgi:hypothetical protein
MARSTPNVPLKIAAAAGLLAVTFVLSGCATAQGAVLGAWLGAVFGGTSDAAAAGALLGASIGAVVDADVSYHDPGPRPDYYGECECDDCRH